MDGHKLTSTIVPHLYIIFAFQQEVGVLLVKRVTKTQAPHLQKVHYVTRVTETEMEKLCTKVFRVYSVKCHESREEEETMRNIVSCPVPTLSRGKGSGDH